MTAIIVKYGNSGETIVLEVTGKSTVADLKRRIVFEINERRKKSELSVEDIAIIYAGKEFADSLSIKDCEFKHNCVVHAVKVKSKVTCKISTALTECVVAINLNDEKECSTSSSTSSDTKSEGRKSSFYVYCCVCKQINSGKLRVRCSKCKEHTLIISSDPKCWNDVLHPSRIGGKCYNELCKDSAAMAEFYFQCASNHSSIEDVSVAVLNLLKYNDRDVPCLACTEVRETVLVYSCVHKHVICYQCFKLHCLSKLNDRQFTIDPNIGYTLSCAVGCENSLIKEINHFRIMGDEAFKIYERFAAEECALQSGGVICPKTNCGTCIYVESDDDIDPDLCNRVVCSKCNHTFCRWCLLNYHVDDCDSHDGLLLLDDSTASHSTISVEKACNSKWNNELSLKAIESTNRCPKCRTRVERNGDCTRMRCIKGKCGFIWCLFCRSQWSRNCATDHWFN